MGWTARSVGGTSGGAGVRDGHYATPLIADLRRWAQAALRVRTGRPGYDLPVAEDPFPRDRVLATLRRLPAYLRLSWRLAKEPLLGRARKAAVAAAAGYLASPIDLVPGLIPVVGQLDDVAVALAALRFALAGLSPERRREHLEAVGLADGDLAEDLATVGATGAWLFRASARTTARVAVSGGQAAVTGGRLAVRAGRRARDVAAPRANLILRRLPQPRRPAWTRRHGEPDVEVDPGAGADPVAGADPGAGADPVADAPEDLDETLPLPETLPTIDG